MKLGFIGLGAMGFHMALKLHKTGNLQYIWNRTPKKAEAFAAQTNAIIASSPAMLASHCNIVLLCVSGDADVLELVQVIGQHIQKGGIVVDTSTVNANTARRAAAILGQYQAHFLDCPVSGGVEGAKHGTLAMMVGGEAAILEKVRPQLSTIARHIRYIGATGSGQATKAVNQVMVAGINQAVTEALAFGDTMGLDMERVIDVITKGAAANWFLDHRGKSMLAGEYMPGFKLSLHYKDLKICQAMIAEISQNSLPCVEMSLIHYQRLIKTGQGDEDISTLFRLKKAVLSEEPIKDKAR